MSETETTVDNIQYMSKADYTAHITEQFWLRLLPENVHDIFLPQNINKELHDGEVVQVVLYQAWYRNFSAFVLHNYPLVVILVVFLATLLIAIFNVDIGLFPDRIWNLFIPFGLFLFWLVYAGYENFRYLQWRLVLTNSRLIFATPQRDAWYLSDNIEMNGKPRVIDTNWTDNQFLRLLQMLTSSRDVAISLQGLQFVSGTAKVKDALVMPDVNLARVEELKRMILG